MLAEVREVAAGTEVSSNKGGVNGPS
jgi:hypothetical protein